ncbi:MAG: AraC family transcriptional regulator, partial [Oscillospiraceae bacterium]
MFEDATLLYEEKYSITVNAKTDPLYYYFDYDVRSYRINMDFQHFHPFYEIMVLLDGKANHIIEGEQYAIRPN